MKKVRKLVKRGTALFLVIMLLALSGCGSGNATKESSPSNEKSGEKGKEENSNGNAKGRYLESDMTLPEGLQQILAMEKLEDGSIGILDGEKGAFVSKDGGKTWEQRDTYLLNQIGENAYIYNAVMGKDGSYFARYYKDEIMDETAEENSDTENNTEMENSDIDTNEQSVYITSEGEDGTIYNTSMPGFQYLYIDKDGNATEITPKLQEEDFVDSIGILSDGSILISKENSIYMVDKATGELTEFCETDGYAYDIKQIGNIVYIIGLTIKGYDLETKTFIEDPVLDEFSAEKLKSQEISYDAGGTKPILLCEGEEENSIYIACNDGLYRHIIGGNVMEEVIKGGLSSLSDPSLSFINLIKMEKEEFLIGYFNYSLGTAFLKKYVYDSEAAAVPEKVLKIYSLTENASIKQAVSDYQKKHSDVFVDYEIGLSGGSGMTKEDAIRNLNTELLSGEGPDIILLDGMPVESYIEKGILADLSQMLTENFEQDAFFENIINTYKKEDNIYAVPSRFQIPVLYADKSVADGITDLTTLADAVEKLREEKETGSIAGLYNEKEVIEKLYDVSSPAWILEDGSIKKEELTAFLTEAKRIYQAEKKGLSEAEIKEHEELLTYSLEYVGEDYYLSAAGNAMEYLAGKQQIGFGRSSCVTTLSSDYSTITSVLKKKEGEQQIKLLPGQKGNVFIPNSVVGICENSSSKELAIDFVSGLLSEDVQGTSVETGFPVNKKAFLGSLESPTEEEGGAVMYIASESADGSGIVELMVEWIDEEEKKQLEEITASLDTSSITDETIKSVVLELAPAALNGEKSIEDTANEIINKIQIYLSE